MKDKKLPLWVTLITIFIFGYIFLISGVIGMIGMAVALACAYKNKEWATKMKRNYIWAYFVGLLFGLLGLLGYWIFYKQVKNKLEEKENETERNKEERNHRRGLFKRR